MLLNVCDFYKYDYNFIKTYKFIYIYCVILLQIVNLQIIISIINNITYNINKYIS